VLQVEIHKKREDEPGFTRLATIAPSTSGSQTRFNYVWTPTEADVGVNELAALVMTQLDPLIPLHEVVADSRKQVDVRCFTVPALSAAGARPAGTCRGEWVGTAVSDTQYKLPPNTHVRTTANVRWTLKQSIFGFEEYTPSGSATVDLFEANGCVATLDPRTVLIDATNTLGTMTIDRNTVPATADGNAGTGIVTTLTDCDGHSQPGWPISVLAMSGPLPLDEQGTAIVGRVVLVDDASVTYTLDVDYRFVPVTE
jgi:hypothetical protein